jgi:RNA polymerase sigma-70 factor, ECF subfamily
LGLVPETRASLLLRLKDRRDNDAWEQFLAIYQPILYRMARSRGYQDADAREIVQDVLVAVSKRIDSFEARNQSGSFRAWLSTIVKHQAINRFIRKPQLQGIGGSDFHFLASQQVDPSQGIELEIEREHRRQLFYLAAQRIEFEVTPATWQAFWQTCVVGNSTASVAKSLKMSIGAIYVARSRVIARIRAFVEEHHDS